MDLLTQSPKRQWHRVRLASLRPDKPVLGTVELDGRPLHGVREVQVRMAYNDATEIVIRMIADVEFDEPASVEVVSVAGERVA
jgi:hypothetical protein